MDNESTQQLQAPAVQANQAASFARLGVDLGRLYLACGGPTTRLEEQLSRAGEAFGLHVEVFGMPTGITLSVEDPVTGEFVTRMARIKEFTINLNSLRGYDRMLEKLAAGELPLRRAHSHLNSRIFTGTLYTKSIIQCGIFTLGVSACYLRYGNPGVALSSGLITVLVAFLVTLLPLSNQTNRLFGDFVSCSLAFGFALIASAFFGLPLGAMAIGTLVIIVPGLTLTTAISELAEQNFLSGTIKLIKASFTLFAMGLAYLLAIQAASFFGVDPDSLKNSFTANLELSPWINRVLVLGLVSSSALLFNAPLKTIPWAALTGLLAWLTIESVGQADLYLITAFSASFVVGLVTTLLGQRFHLPSQIFSVPGILVLVPGMLALSSFDKFAELEHGLQLGLQVGAQAVFMAVAIVFGLMTSKVIFKLVKFPEH